MSFNLGNFLRGAANDVNNVVHTVENVGGQAVHAVQNVVQPQAQPQPQQQQHPNFVQQAGNFVGNSFNNVGHALTGAEMAVANPIAHATTNLVRSAPSLANSAMNGIKGINQGVARGTLDTVGGLAMPAVVGFGQQTIGRLAAPLETGLQMGKQAVTGQQVTPGADWRQANNLTFQAQPTALPAVDKALGTNFNDQYQSSFQHPIQTALGATATAVAPELKALGAAGKVALGATGLGFGAQGVSQIPGEVQAIQQARTPQDKAQAATQLIENTALSGLGVLGGGHELYQGGKEVAPAITQGAKAVNTNLNHINDNVTTKLVDPGTAQGGRGFLAYQGSASGYDKLASQGKPVVQFLDAPPAIEVSDKNMKVKDPGAQALANGQTVALQSVMDHPQMQKQYPGLFNEQGGVNVKVGDAGGNRATFDPNQNLITIDPKVLGNTPERVANALQTDAGKQILGHELSHTVDKVAGVHGVSPEAVQASLQSPAYNRAQNTVKTYQDGYNQLKSNLDKGLITPDQFAADPHVQTYEAAQKVVAKGQPAQPIDTYRAYNATPAEQRANLVGSSRMNMSQKEIDKNPMGAQPTPFRLPGSEPGLGDKMASMKNPEDKNPLERGSADPQVASNRFTERVKNAPQVAPEVQKAVSGQHVVRSTAELSQQADEFLKNNDLHSALNSVHDALSVKDGHIDDQTVARSIKVANQAAYEGHVKADPSLQDAATSIYDSLSNHLVKKGQDIQAASLLMSETPEGKLFRAQRILKKAGANLGAEDSQKLIGLVDNLRGAEPGSQAAFEANQALAHFVNRKLPSGTTDKIFTLWRAGLLSGPRTMTKVLASHALQNTLENASNPATTAMDALVAGVRKAMGKDSFRTTAMTYKGQASGFAEGTKAAKDLLVHNVDTKNTGSLGGLKTEMGRPEVNYDNVPVIGKLLNQYVEKVQNVHAAMPKGFFKAAYNSDLQRQAKAAAINQGIKGSERKAFINDFVAKPSEAAHAEATHAAQMATFQQETEAGKAGAALQKVPGGRVLTPFAHIASAILTDAVNYSPVGAAKTIIEAVKGNGARGWTPEIQKHFVEGLGRSITGTAVLGTGYALYKSGLMTLTYPTDKKQQALWKAEGKQEMSIKIGNQWRQIATLGPSALTLAMGAFAAQSKEVGKNGSSEALTAVSGALQTLSQESFLSGLTGAATAISDPQSKAKSFIKSEASSIVPAFVSTVASATDPLQRQTNNIAEAIASKVPFLREGLMPAQTASGQDMKRDGNVFSGLFDPTRPTTDTSQANPVSQELNRLDLNNATEFPTVTKTIGKGKDAVNLTPQQAYQRTQQAGPQIMAAYQSVMNAPGYAQLSDANKAKALSNAESDVNAVQDVKTLEQLGNTAAAQKAYGGLSANQKAMYNGLASAKDYTAINTDGSAIKQGSNPQLDYQNALAKFNQSKGTMDQAQLIKAQQNVNTLQVKSKYPQAVIDFYGLTNAQKNQAFQQNPQQAKALYDQATQLANDLASAGLSSKTVSTKVSAKKGTGKKSGGVRVAKASGGKKSSINYTKLLASASSSATNKDFSALRNLVKIPKTKTSTSASGKLALKTVKTKSPISKSLIKKAIA